MTGFSKEFIENLYYHTLEGDDTKAAYQAFLSTLSVKVIPDYYFITVNPKPDTNLDVFLKLLANFVKRKPVLDYVYVIEQRGETIEEVGKGFHSHILVSWDPKMSKRVRQFCGETFKRVIGCNSNKIININKIPKEYYKDKIDYMTGLKWDPEKDQKIKIDLIFRQKNNILSLYKNDTLPSEAC